MADGENDSRRKRRHKREYVDPVEVFVISSSSRDGTMDDDITEELCLALEASGCIVRVINCTRGWLSSITTAYWVARRSNLSRLVLVDTHPIALFVLRFLAASRLAYIQRTCHLFTLPVAKCIHQILLRLADDVFVMSRTGASMYQSMFCNCKAPKIVYPCVDVGSMAMDEVVNIKKIIPNLNKFTRIYLTYGIFEPYSNFDLVIDAFEIFHKNVHRKFRRDKVRLVIAGTLNENNVTQTNYYRYLQEKLLRNRVSKDIFIITKLNQRSKKTLLAYCACVVFGYSNYRSIMEALFVGRPILASKSQITKEIIPRRVGFRLPSSMKEYAKALLFIHGDAQLAEKMGHNAKIYYVQHFSFGKYADRMKKFVEGSIFQCHNCLDFYGHSQSSSSESNLCSCIPDE